MSSPRDDIANVLAEKLVIGTGVTCHIQVIPGQNAAALKYGGGGTLVILGTSSVFGCTFAVANQYVVGTAEVCNLNLMGGINIIAFGVTTTAFLLRGRTVGFEDT